MLSDCAVLNEKQVKRVILWALVAAYTIALPHAIFIYNALAKHFSADIAGQVPLILITFFGIIYIICGFVLKKSIKFLWFIVPCVIIVYIILSLETNPNKHIHIPEYILLSWLLFETLSIDYRGKGVYILIFICTSMLGIVDEIQQGIYPERFYGLKDMVINSASVVIGVLTLMGLRKSPEGDWIWLNHFKRFKGSLGIIVFGGIGATFLCVYLLDFKVVVIFWDVYPLWLIIWSLLFIALWPLMIIYHIRRLYEQNNNPNDKKVLGRHTLEITIHLWILSISTILFIIHTLVVFIAMSGWEFN